MIDNVKKSDTWKFQLIIANKFASSIDNDEERVMNSKSDNMEIMPNDEAEEVVEERFELLKNRYCNSCNNRPCHLLNFETLRCGAY